MKTHICMSGLIGWLLKCLPAMAAENAIPPFVAEGRLLTQGFRPDEKTNLNYRTDASFIFIYSNGWWQVEARHLSHSSGSITNVYNCMRIPDGTRTYTLFEGSTARGLVGVQACPTAFPPPGRPELLFPWLSLCPQPELPVTDGQRMRRFINLPHCYPDIFNAPQNEGYYEAKPLAPGNIYLSELLVTNNGFSIELTVAPDFAVGGEIHRVAAPFENGYLELHYQVIESTNINGVAFPLRTMSKRFSPNWGGNDRDDLRVGSQSELTVTRISFSEKDVANRITAPAEMFVMDARPGGRSNIIVRDDQWKPVSDPEIKRRTRSAGQETEKSE